MKRHATILVVDDEPFVLKALRRLFIESEFFVLVAESGREALDIISRHPEIGLVISDFRMPGMNGIELVREIYRLRPAVRRIILSGYADIETVIDSINSGHVHKFIPKPWDDAELIAICREEYGAYLTETKARVEGESLKRRVETLSTKRRELELSLAEKHELLKKSEKRLRRAQIIARLGDWEWYTDREEMLWSEGMFPLFGLDPLTFVPTRESFVSLIHPEDREHFVQQINQAVETASPTVFTHRTVTREGEIRYLTVRGEPIIDQAGRAIGISGTSQDDTERVTLTDHLRELNLELEERIRERTLQLEKKVEELDSFVSAVSHDLRAPMRHVCGFAEILKEQLTPYIDEIDVSLIDRIIAKSRAALDMAEALLSLARIGRDGVRRIDVDLSSMAAEILSELTAAFPERRFSISVEQGLHAFADHQLVTILLTNLLGNAVKYTGHREEAVIRFTRQTGDQGERIFVIEDNGAGFDMRFAARLFQPFQRLHTQTEFPGIGIGLATVQRIVNLHGGWIRAESEPGMGTKFFFSLGS